MGRVGYFYCGGGRKWVGWAGGTEGEWERPKRLQ